MNNMFNIFQNQKRNYGKLFYVIFVLLFIISGVYILIQLSGKTPQEIINQTTNTNKNTNSTTNNNTTSSQTRPEPVVVSLKTPDRAGSFLVSAITTDSSIKDYSFDDNKIIYANERGIFEAQTKKSILNRSISAINFNTTGQAVYQTANEWFVFNVQTARNARISVAGSMPKINKVGNIVASFVDSELHLLNTDTNRDIKIDTGLTITNLGWAYDKNVIAVSGTTIAGTEIKLYNDKGELQNTVQQENDSTFLGIAPNGLSVSYTKEGRLTLRPVDTGISDNVYTFPQNDNIKGSWMNSQSFIAIQTPPPDSLGRVVNYLWKLDLDSGLVFLSDSFPITKRLDTSAQIKTNPAQNVLVLTENTGPLWLLSLLPRQYPFYAESGIFIQTLDPRFSTSGDH